jgi:two-component system, cell cycle sensor histidine kinase and response regulator CckA
LILVVDDDPNVREITSAILSSHGYRVLAAADGAEAISLFAPRSLEIRVVVADLSMPLLDGHALMRVLRNLNPSIRVLAISGQAEQQELFRRQTANPLLPKPFSMHALLASIHDLLRAGDPHAPEAGPRQVVSA